MLAFVYVVVEPHAAHLWHHQSAKWGIGKFANLKQVRISKKGIVKHGFCMSKNLYSEFLYSEDHLHIKYVDIPID